MINRSLIEIETTNLFVLNVIMNSYLFYKKLHTYINAKLLKNIETTILL